MHDIPRRTAAATPQSTAYPLEYRRNSLSKVAQTRGRKRIQMYHRVHNAAIMKSPIPFIALLFVLVVPLARAAESTQQHLFKSRRTVGSLDRVVVQIEVGGDLKEKGKDKIESIATSELHNLEYDERTLEIPAASGRRCRAIRYYDKAAAVIKVRAEGAKPELRPKLSVVGVEVTADTTTLFSPAGPLTRDELDLIDVAGNSLLLDRLLPEQAVPVGYQWKQPDEFLAALLRLDKVTNSDVQCTLKEVTDAVGRFEMAGHVTGTFNDVSTEIEVKAKYRYDRRTERIDWFGLAAGEQREISDVMAGFDVVYRIQVRITPLDESAALSDAALQGKPLESTPELCQLVYQSGRGGWELRCDRRWHVTKDQPDLVAMKLLDRGKVLVHCNISPVPQAPPDKAVSLAAFQDDIRRALAKSFGEFLEAGQTTNEAGHRVYRVAVRGEIDKMPIRWLYYLVGAPDGRQVAFAFSLQEDVLDRLEKADEQMIHALRFVAPNVAGPSK
jgi:hypothetical protein